MTYSLHTLQKDAPVQTPLTGFRRFAQEIALTAGFVFLAFWFLALVDRKSTRLNSSHT